MMKTVGTISTKILTGKQCVNLPPKGINHSTTCKREVYLLFWFFLFSRHMLSDEVPSEGHTLEYFISLRKATKGYK